MKHHTIESLGLLAFERPAKTRAGFPRFLVKVDCQWIKIKTLPSLRKTIASIYSETPRIFVNAGNGLTIDFDDTKPAPPEECYVHIQCGDVDEKTPVILTKGDAAFADCAYGIFDKLREVFPDIDDKTHHAFFAEWEAHVLGALDAGENSGRFTVHGLDTFWRKA